VLEVFDMCKPMYQDSIKRDIQVPVFDSRSESAFKLISTVIDTTKCWIFHFPGYLCLNNDNNTTTPMWPLVWWDRCA